MSATNTTAGSPAPAGGAAGFQPQSTPGGAAASPPFAVAVQQQAATLLTRLYEYLEKNAAQYPILMNGVPTVFEAVDLYGRGMYPQALAQTMLIYQWVDGQRASVPPLQVTG
jgi:hypothetical protein